MKYRLLTEDDVIQVGDELLNDDCETWDDKHYASKEENGRWFLGIKFSPLLFMPHRRKVSDKPTEGN